MAVWSNPRHADLIFLACYSQWIIHNTQLHTNKSINTNNEWVNQTLCEKMQIVLVIGKSPISSKLCHCLITWLVQELVKWVDLLWWGATMLQNCSLVFIIQVICEHGEPMMTIMPAGITPDSSAKALCQTYLKGSLTCHKILRHGTSGFTSHPKEGVLWIFITLKNPLPWSVWTGDHWVQWQAH
jgi:hypothetical protein